MKVNYNAKTGDSIRLNTGMGCQGEFHVADTYPEGVKLKFGDRKISFTYEELKAMDAEFVMSEPPDLDTVQWTLSFYIEKPEEAVNTLIEVYGIIGNRLRQAKHDEDLKAYGEWLPIYQNLSHAVSQVSV